MLLHRANTAYNYPTTHTRTTSPRSTKPTFIEGSTLEERDKSGHLVTRYRVGKLLGRGGFAKCYEVTDLDTNVALAAKVIDRVSLQKSKTMQKMQTEIAIHRRMKHKNIVNFYKTFQDEYNIYILLELCPSQTLMEVSKTRKRFSTAETQFIMVQTLSALQYMHENNVIHRDLKLGNMMLDVDMNLKLGDFGLAAELAYDGERKRTICGTPNYIAPEILEGARNGHSFEVDVWSLGVILFTLLVGEPPFQTQDVKMTYNRIKQCRYTFPSHLDIPEAAKQLVHRILQSMPSRRPTLIDIRSDPFFKLSGGAPLVAPPTMFPVHLRRARERDALVAPQPLTARDVNALPDKHQDLFKKPVTTSAPVSSRDAFAARSENPTKEGNLQHPLSARTTRTQSYPTLPTQPKVPMVGGWCAPAAEKPEPVPVAPKATQKPVTADEEDRHQLNQLHDELHKTLLEAENPKTGSAAVNTCDDQPANAPTVWVTHYADFSAKYGLAYKLNTGHTGVHFNDSTKMIWEPITNRVEYYARVKETINGVVHAQDSRSTFHMDSFPETLNKKVTLIKYFKSYLNKSKGTKDGIEVITCSPYKNNSPVLLTEPHMVSDMSYVKRSLQTEQAMIFRLSNRTIQVCFFDRTEVILSSESKVVTYTEPNGQRKTIPLTAIGKQNDEVASRLKYTKDILCKFINNKEL